ncbi:MAG: PSD1 and planctomycete cytochrome C domain-containing protein [Fuerstiella sp.]|nr:PSD1 and planctomycete cytochrome C domain-containing protein [Fuerstiella sp.]
MEYVSKTEATQFLIAVAAFVCCLAPGPAESAETLNFSRDVRPLLSDHCFSCHGPDEEQRMADLRLDQSEDYFKDRNGHQVLDPEDPTRSTLLERITAKDPDLRMPPPAANKPLTEAEIDILRRWIMSGAPMTEHWAFVPPKRHKTPVPKDRDWPEGWIDDFILHRLDSEDIGPSPDADVVTLMRRLHFDLTGLPPSPEIVNRYAANPEPEAYEQIVDELLESDASAERLAVYWLDLVRYADTVGYHGDQDHPISPYRDWVIDAFASNMPFDQFTREQLAGDLISNSTIDQKIASGYNRLLQTSHEGGVQPEEYLSIYAADRIRNLSAVWMGATVGCAQCHDHKYDPYTSRDFYSLVAFFADLDEDQHFYDGNNRLPTKRAPELVVLSRRDRSRLAALEIKLQQIESQLKERTNDQRLLDLKQGHTESIRHLEESKRRTMISRAKEPRTIRVLPRGNWLDDTGEIVGPAVPEFLGTVNSAAGNRATRLDLANWLTDAAHGTGQLTARVFVNRFWYLLFGRGLAASLDDFGGQGIPPDHPELLDRLAFEFIDSKWNVRHILKQIVMSHTYRQSSKWTSMLQQRDPENRLIARQTSMRLPAEMIRDNALHVAGLLVRNVGGPSVRPYQPAGYYRHLNFPKRNYSHHDDERQWRRGIYVHWQRQFLHPMLKAFDAPSREECTAQRFKSNTPLAALTLLNDPTFVEAASAFATRVLVENPNADTSTRLRFVMLEALNREPDTTEIQLLTELLEQSRNSFRQSDNQADQLISAGLSPPPPDIDTKELAAWTMVARTVLNLDELITRN